MSTRIGLAVHRAPDLDLIHRGVTQTRLFYTVEFETPSKGLFIQSAIIDTGAPLCLIPSDLWQHVPRRLFEATRIGGFVSRNECSVPARLGILSMTLVDAQAHRVRVIVRAFLAETPEVPLILGFQDCLEKAILHVAVPRDEAWLEFEKDR